METPEKQFDIATLDIADIEIDDDGSISFRCIRNLFDDGKPTGGGVLLRLGEENIDALLQAGHIDEHQATKGKLASMTGTAAALECELDEVVRMVAELANGERSSQELIDWVAMNFPKEMASQLNKLAMANIQTDRARKNLSRFTVN